MLNLKEDPKLDFSLIENHFSSKTVDLCKNFLKEDPKYRPDILSL